MTENDTETKKIFLKLKKNQNENHTEPLAYKIKTKLV